MELLLEVDGKGGYVHKGINPGAINDFAIRIAAVNGHERVVKLLLGKGGYGQYIHKTVDPDAAAY